MLFRGLGAFQTFLASGHARWLLSQGSHAHPSTDGMQSSTTATNMTQSQIFNCFPLQCAGIVLLCILSFSKSCIFLHYFKLLIFPKIKMHLLYVYFPQTKCGKSRATFTHAKLSLYLLLAPKIKVKAVRWNKRSS